MKLINFDNLGIVDTFIRLFGEPVRALGSHSDRPIIFRKLKREDNQYDDIMVRLGNTIYISEECVGMLGLTEVETLAVIAHEIGHVIYATRSWDPDCEQRADSVAADIGLGSQMISAIEKIIESRRYPRLTSQLVNRIHFLQNIVYASCS